MLGIANPLGVLALASVAVLIALTRLARRRHPSPVSSLLLWKQITAPPVERQRFRPDLLFMLRLALLLALAGGYVGPYLLRPGGGAAGGLAVVLDASASMQVREEGGRRFDLARRRLDALVAALPADTPVLLVAAGDRPRVALRWTADRGRLAERLASLEPLDTPTALAPAVELALGEARRRPGARVAVLTDLAPGASGLSPSALAAVDWTAIGQRGDNVAITALTVDPPPFADVGEVRIEAVVRNFGAAPRSVTLDASLDGVAWVRHGIEVAARGTRRVPLGPAPRGGVLRVRLPPGDALASDDEALAWVPAHAPLDVLLVTESDAFAAAFRALVATTPRGHVEVVNRAGLTERSAVTGVSGIVTVFDRLAPPEAAGVGSALYVAPPPGNTPCPSARPVEDASVVDWEPGHPVLSGFGGLEAVEAVRAMQLLPPSGWGTVVATAASRRAAYPFLVVGEMDGQRRACLAAELPAGPATSDAMPLLLVTLGTLRWLAEPVAGTPITVPTGVAVRVPGAAVDPVPGVRAVGDPSVVLAERAGVHRLREHGAGERLVLASLLDESESDVGRDGGGVWPATAPAPTPATPGRTDLSWWLYAAAAALLALEWLAWGVTR